MIAQLVRKRTIKTAIALLLSSSLVATSCGTEMQEIVAQSEATGSADTSSSEPTSTEFCTILNESITTMSTRSNTAGSSGSEQLGLVIANLSEINRTMERLADVAPQEIQTDMRIVSDSWRTQTSAIGGDLAGSTAQILVSGILSSASYEVVDSWSLANCGVGLVSGRPMAQLAPDSAQSSYEYEETFHLTSEEGWEYDVWIGWNYGATFGKDVSTSPPGKALWWSEVQGSFDFEAVGTLEGRTAPNVYAESIYVGYGLPREFNFTDRRLSQTSSCNLSITFITKEDAGFTSEETSFICEVENGNSLSSYENVESEIDEMLSLIQPQAPRVFLVTFSGFGSGCQIAMWPDDNRPPANSTFSQNPSCIIS